MFENLQMAPPDSILGLTEAFRKDSNPLKINLSVGVYQDSLGKTPILECVKLAEREILETEASKGYLSIEGLANYGRLVRELTFGPLHEALQSGRAVTAQTPGGTGALRVAGDFLRRALLTPRIWIPRPTWANHPSIFQAAGFEVLTYPYLDPAGKRLDTESMLSALRDMRPNDLLLLHACCHNPTGVDLSVDAWRSIANSIDNTGAIPLIDFAYQGFGDGIEEDAFGVRHLAGEGRELLVCNSFSKNFGLYGERVGAVTIVAKNREAAEVALSNVKVAIRSNYSNPPQHGAAIVQTVLSKNELREKWKLDVAAMRNRIHDMRAKFVAGMETRAPKHDFSFLRTQKGMFSYSGLTPVQVDELKTKHGIYIVATGGRMNVAGLTDETIPRVCDAVASVL